jgi:hypothetical protein
MTLDMKFGENLAARFGPLVTKMIELQNLQPTDKEVYPPVLSMCLSVIAEMMQTDTSVFVETTKTIFAFDFLAGFAPGRLVLEFLFILMELGRNLTATPKDLSPFDLYGEGVMLTAAAIIRALQQERLVFATNIGRRLRTIDLPDQNQRSPIQLCSVPCVRERYYEG